MCRCGALAAEMETLAPDLAGAEVFRDPDQLAAARELIKQARASGVPLFTPLPRCRFDDLALGPASRPRWRRSHVFRTHPRHPAPGVGGPGLGKTHLLHGARNAPSPRPREGPLACLNAQAFAAELSTLRSADDLNAWRARYRWVAALLLDDLAKEYRAQEELLRLVAS